MKSKSKKWDLIILLVYPIFAVMISHLFKVNFMWSIVLFFFLPVMYLVFRDPKFFKKTVVFTLIVTPLVAIIDYIAEATGQWFVYDSILPRVLGYISVESLIWNFFYLVFILMFYEHFLHHHFIKNPKGQRLKMFFLIVIFLFCLFLLAHFLMPLLLFIPYFYLWFGVLLTLIPVLLQLFKFPQFTTKFFHTMAYFFYLTFLYEITAVQLGWWSYPSNQFIGWISIFNVRFPLEELIFWMILCTMAVLSYYEYFDAGEK